MIEIDDIVETTRAYKDQFNRELRGVVIELYDRGHNVAKIKTDSGKVHSLGVGWLNLIKRMSDKNECAHKAKCPFYEKSRKWRKWSKS